jgi:hypothetical protein
LREFTDANKWKESPKKTEYANELLTAKEEDLSSGVKRLAMNFWLQDNEKDSRDLFTRNCQRELWNELLSYLEATKSSHAIITGNPGIGKSRSMAYFLKLLLQGGKTLIYETRKDFTTYQIAESVSRLDLKLLIKALSPGGIDIDPSEQGGPSMVFIYDVLTVPTIITQKHTNT